jgi:hypothetical protein
MKKAILIVTIFFISCSGSDKNVEYLKKINYSDSIILKSKSLHDSASKTLVKADKLAENKVIQVINQVNRVNEELNNLKLVMKSTQAKEIIKEVVKEIIVHDTIYITEKKNFWGKTKIKIDSSKSTTEVVDSSLNENNN